MSLSRHAAALLLGAMLFGPAFASGTVQVTGTVATNCTLSATSTGVNVFSTLPSAAGGTEVGEFTYRCNAASFDLEYSSATAGQLTGPGSSKAYTFRTPGLSLGLGTRLCTSSIAQTNIGQIVQSLATPATLNYDNSDSLFNSPKTQKICAILTAGLPSPAIGGNYTDVVTITLTPL